MGDQCTPWLSASRSFTSSKSLQAGAPRDLTLLLGAPNPANPAWKRAPCFAAQSLLPPAPAGADGTLLSMALWATGASSLFWSVATPYPHLAGTKHRVQQLLPRVVEYALADYQEQHNNHKQHAAGSRSGGLPSTAEHARRLCLGLAADMQSWALRSLGWALTYAFRWLFGCEVYVDQAGLHRLRQLAGSHALVYVPTHKSHVDYLMLSYILFAAGLPCPHIAAGDNLSLPIIGRWLRHCGAFFIRRTSQGARDSTLYKRVLAGYVRSLLAEGHSLEFFIEGGRSRDGRVGAPKLGLLSYVVDAVVDGDLMKGVVCVPTSMSYDLCVEERALAQQLAGASKRKESLGGLLCSVASLLRSALLPAAARVGGGFNGRCSVAFGEPILIEPFLQERAIWATREAGTACPCSAAGDEATCAGACGLHGSVHRPAHSGLADSFPKGSAVRRMGVSALGEEIAAQLRTHNVLSTSVLIVGAMEAAAVSRSVLDPMPTAAADAGDEMHCNGLATPHPTDTVLGSISTGTEISQACTTTTTTSSSTGGTLSEAAVANVVGGVGRQALVAGVSLESLQRSVEWVSGELELRGAPVMRLPSARGVRTRDVLVQAVRLLHGCLALTNAAEEDPVGPSSSGCACDGSTEMVRREPGVEASLRLHMRLNQLLPWVAGEGLLTCALLAEARCQVSTPAQPGIPSSTVREGAVLRRALWLRQLLSPEIDTALSPGSLRTEDSLREVLQLLEARGAVAWIPDTTQRGGARLRLASTGSSRDAALFAARILSPHIATYAAVLRAAHSQLSGRPGGMSSKSLLQAVQSEVLEAAAAAAAAGAGPVLMPSLMLAQGAITALSALGVLTTGGAGHAATALDAAAAATAGPSAGACQELHSAGAAACSPGQVAGLAAGAAEEAASSPPDTNTSLALEGGAPLMEGPVTSPMGPLPNGQPPRPCSGAGLPSGLLAEPCSQPSRPFGNKRGRQPSPGTAGHGGSSTGSESESEDPVWDPLAASVSLGLSLLGGRSRSHSCSLERMQEEEEKEQEAPQLAQGECGHPEAGPSSGPQPVGQPQPGFGHKSAAEGGVAGTEGAGAACKAPPLAARQQQQRHHHTPPPDTVMLTSSFASEAALQGLLADMQWCYAA